MNEATTKFVEELKMRPDVLGVIMFGSWARGNNHPGSDVDLVVILTEGFRRTVEYHDEQAFEIIYTSENGAFDYWNGHKDDAAGLWAVAKVLYDKDGTVERLCKNTEEMLAKGKTPMDQYQLGQLRFDAEDSLRYVERILEDDPATGNLILSNKIFGLAGLFFDIRQKWTPAPKQQLEEIKTVDLDLYTLFCGFYNSENISQRLEIAKKIVPLVFE